MRYTPLKQQGRHGQQMEQIRARVWPRILQRNKHRCEGCGLGGVTLEWAHLFGRPSTGLGLGEWANCEELCAALCIYRDGNGCHERYDRHLDLALRTNLQIRAVNRFALAYHPLFVVEPDWKPEDSLREILRQLEENERWEWDGRRMVVAA